MYKSLVWLAVGAAVVYYFVVKGKSGTLMQGPSAKALPTGKPAKPGTQVYGVNLGDVKAGAALGSDILQTVSKLWGSSNSDTAEVPSATYQDTTGAANILADSGTGLDVLNQSLTPEPANYVELPGGAANNPDPIDFNVITAGTGGNDYTPPYEVGGGTDGNVSIEGFTS